MNRHLVTIKIGVKSGADAGMDLNGIPLDKDGKECLNSQFMERRGTIQEHRVIARDVFQYVIDFRSATLQDMFG